MTPDNELLRDYSRTNSEAAFAELVKRHVHLVYSAALRQTNGDEHLAKDVAQTVFTDLAKKASSLTRRENLSGWLYISAHFAAAKLIRGENRRRDREETFMRESISENPENPPDAEWQKIRPTLDDAMHELKESDRNAILLRYFENQPFIQIGAKLGLNENAARMRVERALEKLRGIFAKRGITTTISFASAISANAIQLAPANLAATLTAASIASAGTGTFTLLKIMTATKIKLAVSAIVVAGAATAIVVQQQTQNKLRGENESLQQQIAQLQTNSENFSNRLAEIGDAKKLPDEQFAELLRLRGEVGVLRRQTNELGKFLLGSQKSALIQNSPNGQPPPDKIPQDISKDSLQFAGYATPTAGLQSVFWAANQGDLKTFFSSLTPETRGKIISEMEKEGDINNSDWMQQRIKEDAGNMDTLHIVGETMLSDNEAMVDFDTGGKTISMEMIKIGNDWKFARPFGQ